MRGKGISRQLAFYKSKLESETDSWDLFAMLSLGQNVVVIDARSADAYRQEHIPGALSLPHRAMDEAAVGGLDRGALYVIYCDGIGCNASTKGAYNLARLGLRVKELIGGLDWWRRDGYATDGTCGSDGKRMECGCVG